MSTRWDGSREGQGDRTGIRRERRNWRWEDRRSRWEAVLGLIAVALLVWILVAAHRVENGWEEKLRDKSVQMQKYCEKNYGHGGYASLEDKGDGSFEIVGHCEDEGD